MAKVAPKSTEPVAPTLMKIDRAGLVDVYETLAAIKGSLDEVMHRWRAASMRQQLKALVEPIIEQRDDVAASRPVEFEEDRESLARRCSLKDADGAPRVSGNVYTIDPARQSEFDTGMAKLRDKHKKSLDAFDKAVKAVNAFLAEEVDVPVLSGRLKLSWFNKTTNQSHLETLFPLIDCDVDLAVMDASKPVKSDKA